MKKRSSGQESTTNLGLGKVPTILFTVCLNMHRQMLKQLRHSCFVSHVAFPNQFLVSWFTTSPATGLQLLSRSPHAVSTKQMFPPSFPLDHGSLAQECQICPNSPWAQIRQTTNSIQKPSSSSTGESPSSGPVDSLDADDSVPFSDSKVSAE